MNEVLSDEAVSQALAGLPGWDGDAGALRQSIEFPDFPSAIRAVVEVAAIAEQMDHHPDMDIRWRTVTFTLRTHSVGGVTTRDLDLARRISDVAGPA